MKKLLSALMSLALICSMLLSAGISALAESKAISVKIGTTTKSFSISSGADIADVLNEALYYCSQNATAARPATVKTPSGTFYPERVIYLASNTTLDFTGTVLVKGNTGAKNVLVSPPNETGGYAGLTNVKIKGGTLKYSDDYSLSHCLVRIAHASDILIESVSFEDSVDSHDIELAACKNLTVRGCRFEGQTMTSTATSLEALQIDILEKERHFLNMEPYDDTMNSGITVTGCTFRNLYRALGTHSLFEGLYQSGISITNNTFESIASTAISCSNYINTTIKGNVIRSCGEGIHFYMMKADDNLADVCKPEQATPVINTSCKTSITDNTIDVRANSATKTASPIYVFGNNITAAKSKRIAAGDYYVGGITIKGNAITSDGYGIRLYDVKKSKISNNTITFKGKSASMYGVLAGAKSNDNTFSSNTIKGFEGGFNIKEASKRAVITGNTIKGSSGNAIILQDSATADKISKNTIDSAKKTGILLKERSSSASSIDNNSISKCDNGISLYGKAGKISGNTFTSNKGFGMYIAATGSAEIYTNSYSKNKKGTAYKAGKSAGAFTNLATPSFSLSKKGKSVTVKWSKPKVKATYVIYRSTSKSGTYKKIASISSSKGAYTDKKLKKGKTYYYKIRATRSMSEVKLYSGYKTKSIKL